MNELEARLRGALVERVAGTPIPTMPRRTIRRIRLRQVSFGATLGTVLAAGGVLVVTILGVTPSTPRVVPPAAGQGPTSVLEEVPAGWPTVDVLDPAGAYSPPGADVDAIDGVRVLATGTVEGYGFSFLAWTGSGDPADEGPDGPCILFVGPSPTSTNGGGGGPISSTCGHFWDPPIADGTDLIVTSQQNRAAEGVGATFGFVSARVSTLVVTVHEGDTHAIPILSGPVGWAGVRAFLVFAPADRSGEISALAADGSLLARGPTCRFRPGAGGACTVEAEQIAPMPPR